MALTRSRYLVSILLLLELAFEGDWCNCYHVGDYLFQSFFYWNWLSKLFLDYFHMPFDLVSILLLLELAFEECRD